MPHEKSLRVQQRNARRNKSIRTYTRSRVAIARRSIESTPDQPETESALKVAIIALDKAVTKGILHKNNAARRKSRLMQRFNKATALN